MKFKSFVGKVVLVEGKAIKFHKEEYETDNEAEIKALSKALNVEQVAEKKAAAK